ncbi:hypothetical protein AB6A40_002560 [Gnathostoma spinigerum]|uniref:Palmitoyltransferase n=1 Tax=Gnathostoma spinigerum TaxID=75299 RepID=A0ABD6EEM0_9BILA
MHEESEINLVEGDLIKRTIGRIHKLADRSVQDLLAIIILFVLLPLGFLVEIFVVLPYYFPIFSQSWIVRLVLLSYFGLNAFINIYKIVKVGPNGLGSDLPALNKPGFRYCYDCQLNEPPRSFHCPVCDKCAFRRDHHCSFVATCIGHFNHRYYVAAVCSLLIIASVCLTWNLSLMWDNFGGLSIGQIWLLIVPHIALIFRVISLSDFIHIVLFSVSFGVVLFLVYLIGAQIFCLWRGQTRVEYLMGIEAYHLGFLENIRQAFGRRWPLIFFSPFVTSPLDSDGLSFITRESVSVAADTKDM